MSMPFKVSHFPQAEAQLRALARRAAAQGVYAAFSEAAHRIDEHLRSGPLRFGDPEYNTKHPGGVVCHGIEPPLLVRFAVYEAEQTVLVIEFAPLPNSSLVDE
jgi:hypothetical protein